MVCVGNIVLGGTGKTPLILKLLKDLRIERVAVLSRGYLRPKHPRLGSWEEVGDEPALIKAKFPKVALYIDADRVRAAKAAVRDGYRLLLMDDGMQHLRIKKDLLICTVDGENPYGGGMFLPFGRLRDLPEMLSKADLVVVKGPKVEGMDGVRVRMVPKEDDFSGKVAIFCGIGKPGQFKRSVEGLGVEVVHELFLGDHEEVGVERLRRFSEESVGRGAKMLLCTEKDMVKLFGYPKTALPIKALEMELEVVEGEEIWSKMIKRIQYEAVG